MLSRPLDSARLQRAAREQARADWEARCERLLDRYFDNAVGLADFRDHLRRLYPHNAALMMNNLLRLNLVRKIVDAKARLYRQAPQRVLLGEDGAPLSPDSAAAKAFARILRQVRLNAKLKWILRFYELLNAGVLWGQVDFRRGLPTLTVLAPHQLIVEQNPDAPSDLSAARAIYVPVGGAPDSMVGEASTIGYLEYRLEDGSKPSMRVRLCDADLTPIPKQPIELAAYASLTRYPFLLLRKGEPLDAELFPDAPEGLLLAADWLDHELTRGALNARQVDFPAYAFNGTAEELGGINPIMGAGSVLCLGDDGKELKALPVNARESERNENILFFLKLFAQMNELSPSSFAFDVTPLSGTAKFHDKQPEIEYREDLVDVLVPFEEEDVFPMLSELLLAARHPAAEELAGLRLGVSFNTQMIPLSREEELGNLEREFRLGLRTPADWLCERLGLDRRSAEERLVENGALYRAVASGRTT